MDETSRKKPFSEESGGSKRSSEELEAENEILKRRVIDLEKTKTDLEKRVEDLSDEIKHLKKPKWAKPNKKTAKKEVKKIGAKAGHKVNPRRPIEQSVDQEVVWVPELCGEGSGPLPWPSKWHEHTQIDIPAQQKVIVTKHVVGWSYCAGCRKYHGALHEKLSKSKYGPNLHAFVAYLKFDLGLTLGKIQRMLLGQYSLKVSTGVISEMITRCGDRFKSEYDEMKISLTKTSHLHADETGWRNGGNNEWLWSFSNDKLSVYVIVPSRAQRVVKDILGDAYGGILVSDFYGGYNKISCRKQKCWTHLLRELHVLKEKLPEDREVEYFKVRLERFFERANKLKREYLAGSDIDSQIKRLETNTLVFLTKTYTNKKLNTLVKRMTRYYFDLYTFIKTIVPATNNPAEREIRPAVVIRKTSYCNRSEKGKSTQAILMSMIATSKKNNRDFISSASGRLKNRIY